MYFMLIDVENLVIDMIMSNVFQAHLYKKVLIVICVFASNLYCTLCLKVSFLCEHYTYPCLGHADNKKKRNF